MIYEFVGFPAYEAAVESEIGLLGVLPVDASNELGIRLGRIYKLVRKGVMDLVRVTRYDGSVSLYVPLRSIRAYQTGVNKRSPTMLSHWRLAMLDSDRPGACGRGLRSSCSAFCPSPGASNTGTYSHVWTLPPFVRIPCLSQSLLLCLVISGFQLSYSSLDDFKLFSAVFLKGFNFSFPAVIRIQSVAFRPTHFWPFQDNLFLYKRFHCS